MSQEMNENRIERLIEEFAIQMEPFGMPRLAGKLLAALLFADPPEKSTQDLIRLTGGSKGAISQMLRFLGNAGPIEKCASRNKRGYSYRLRRHFLMPLIEEKIAGIRGLREFLIAHQEDFDQLSDHARENIEEILEFHTFFQRAMQQAFEEWKTRRNSRREKEDRNRD